MVRRIEHHVVVVVEVAGDPADPDLVAFLEAFSGSEILVERPKSPPYGLLKFPMSGQW